MKAKRRYRQRSGFTLIELLVAIAVLGISMTLVLGIYSSVFSLVDRVDETTSFQNRSSLLVDQLQRDFFGIYKGRSGFFRAELREDVASGAPIFEFTTSSQLKFKTTETSASISVVRYYLEKTRNNPIYTLYRSEIPYLFRPEKSAVNTSIAMVVGEHVADIRLSFKDRYGEFLDQWQARSSNSTDGPNDDRFPRLVRMEVEMATGAEPGAEKKTVFVSIDIPVAQLVTADSSGEG